ncbi:unnamed protein product [Gemmata massiliana]|uniref:Uncharacterized protein n=1 Tax=Gemmata massiliana TaxID=1210884 RepID=A0A6P2DJV1_9BACT|nr:unnamed protein product [Gemmata massiliana]
MTRDAIDPRSGKLSPLSTETSPQLSEEIKVYIGLSDQVYVEPPRKRVGGRDQVYVTGATKCAGITPERDQVYVENSDEDELACKNFCPACEQRFPTRGTTGAAVS